MTCKTIKVICTSLKYGFNVNTTYNLQIASTEWSLKSHNVCESKKRNSNMQYNMSGMYMIL